MANSSARSTDLSFLHPVFRGAVGHVLEDLAAQGAPFKLFEAFRHPARQQYLFAEHPPVTHARPWQSYHQYGVGADFVLFLNGQWSWRTDGHYGALWQLLHETGAKYKLEPLSFEQPHLQLAGCTWRTLNAGNYPAGGDELWAENLEAAIVDWHGRPLCPTRPPVVPMRPPLESATGGIDATTSPLTAPPTEAP